MHEEKPNQPPRRNTMTEIPEYIYGYLVTSITWLAFSLIAKKPSNFVLGMLVFASATTILLNLTEERKNND
jgi:hypothetical protein